jgi:16S rRNA (guanine527-N7)-methyltransferase
MDIKNLLISKAKEIGVKVSPAQAEQFQIYLDLLLERNTVMNLTAITDPEEAVIKHFVDSLTLLKALEIKKNAKVIDVGTGAGFPGMAIGIMRPDMKILLLDSLKKRVNFLEESFELLGLEGIKAIHGRAEEYAKNKEYREKYDLCVSRAVSNLATLSEYCLPYVKIGGTFISYKSGTVQEEAEEAEKAINILGGQVKDITYFKLPDSEIDRSLVIINKKKSTPGKYPRKAGTPLKEPLS